MVKLPSKLMDVFSGVKNAYTQVCNARIQCVYDPETGQEIDLSRLLAREREIDRKVLPDQPRA